MHDQPTPPARRRQLEDERPEGALAEIEAMAVAYDDALRGRIDLLVCPPATLVAPVR